MNVFLDLIIPLLLLKLKVLQLWRTVASTAFPIFSLLCVVTRPAARRTRFITSRTDILRMASTSGPIQAEMKARTEALQKLRAENADEAQVRSQKLTQSHTCQHQSHQTSFETLIIM
jgi:hypothetical protein